MEMFRQFIDQKPKTIGGTYTYGCPSEPRGLVPRELIILVSSVRLNVILERWGKYSCVVRSRSFGRWLGTKICGFALCPDILN